MVECVCVMCVNSSMVCVASVLGGLPVWDSPPPPIPNDVIACQLSLFPPVFVFISLFLTWHFLTISHYWYKFTIYSLALTAEKCWKNTLSVQSLLIISVTLGLLCLLFYLLCLLATAPLALPARHTQTHTQHLRLWECFFFFCIWMCVLATMQEGKNYRIWIFTET